MGRKSRRDTSRRSAETFDFANEVASPSPKKRVESRPFVTHTAPKLTQIEDRRTWHPDGKTRPARSLNKSQHRLVIATNRHTSPRSTNPVHTKKAATRAAYLPHQIQFQAPKQVLVCIRRKKRKEVLFAKKLTGKGARARRHRSTEYTGVKC